MLSITKLVTVILLVLASPFLNPLSEDFSGLVTSFHQDEQHVCSIYIYTDPFLWRQVYKMEDQNATATYDRIRRIIKRSVREANRVYNTVEFYGNGRKIHKGIHFDLTDYFIDNDLNCGPTKKQTPWNFHEMDCDEPDVPMVEICGHKPKCRLTNNVFCNDIRSMRFFLHAFSAMKHDKHCLSFAFTYREMSDFQGIAWIKGHNPNDSSTLDHFGYCANDDASRCLSKTENSEEIWPQHYYRNTGAVNLHLIRGVLSEKSAIHIFIHELGHSLGARHDNESEECINLTDEVFLMTGDAKKIILGQTEGHFSTCSSLAIGLNLDKSTCWTQRRGAKNMCNARISLDSNRKCLDQVLTNESLNSAQVDLFTLSIYTGMAAIMLILSASACILCSYRRCSGGNSRASLTHHHQRRTSSQLVIKDTRLHHHHHGLLMKSSRSSMQNGNNLLHSGGYAQIIAGSQCNSSKNGSEWLVVSSNGNPDYSHSDDSALTV